jgi:uncharacterized membrane protein
MLERLVFGAIAAALSGFLLIEPAEAGFRVCNRSNQRVDVAFGYPHQQFGWTSEGWWTIQSGECRTVMNGDLGNRYYYLYAQGAQGGRWQAPDSQDGGYFCVQNEAFVFQNRTFQHGNAVNCEEHNLHDRHFLVIDTEGAANHTHNLRD